MFLLRVSEDDATELIYLAGYLAGAGLPEAETLKRVLGTAIDASEIAGEVIDNFGERFEGDTDEMGTVPDLGPEVYPEDEDLSEFAGMVPGGDVPHINPDTDPTSPERLGIALEQHVEGPPPAPPSTPQDDFGAGPPGRS